MTTQIHQLLRLSVSPLYIGTLYIMSDACIIIVFMDMVQLCSHTNMPHALSRLWPCNINDIHDTRDESYNPFRTLPYCSYYYEELSNKLVGVDIAWILL